jgi:CRP-like cAMP-binding protein
MSEDVILRNIARFVDLDRRETDYFLSLLQERTLARKEFLLRAGEVCRYETFIGKGCLRTYSIDETGQEHIVGFGIEDWWAGDLFSFLTQSPARYFIDALENSTVLQIDKQNLDKLYVEVPKFERFFRILFQNAFISWQDRTNQNLAESAEQRYLHFTDKYPDLEARIPQKHIAAYLGITPVFLSMLRRRRMRKRVL